MKTKLFLMAICFATAFHANAQTEKGNQLIGGLISFRSESNKGLNNYAKAKVFQVNPNYGYFIGKNFAIGATLNFTHVKQEAGYDVVIAAGSGYITSTTVQSSKQDGYGIGPFLRYYVDITEKFKFYGQFNAMYGAGKLKTTAGGTNMSNTYKAYSANVLPGLAIFPSKTFAIEMGFNLLSYAKQNYKSEGLVTDKSSVENYSFGFSSFSPVIGINFHF